MIRPRVRFLRRFFETRGDSGRLAGIPKQGQDAGGARVGGASN